MVENLPVNAPDVRDSDSIPELGRSPGEGNGNPLQYSCLGNPMGRGTWQAVVHRVAENWTRLSTHTHTYSTYHFNHLQVYSLLTLTTFTMLRNYHYLYPNFSPSPVETLYLLNSSSPFLPLSLVLVTSSLPSVSLNLPILICLM